MIDARIYTNKQFHQLLKGSPKYQIAIAESETWMDVVTAIDSLNIRYTAEQLNYVWQLDWE